MQPKQPRFSPALTLILSLSQFNAADAQELKRGAPNWLAAVQHCEQLTVGVMLRQRSSVDPVLRRIGEQYNLKTSAAFCQMQPLENIRIAQDTIRELPENIPTTGQAPKLGN
jgi:hypothetical protein